MTATPLVSAVMPVYNGAAWLEKSLSSLLAQDWPRLEILIGDDASSDGSAAICERIAAADPRVTIVRNPKNLGRFENLYAILERAKGDCWFWASQDDWWEPGFVSTLARLLADNPDAACAQGAVRVTDQNGRELRVSRFNGAANPCQMTGYQWARSLLTKLDLAGASTENAHFIHGLLRTDVYRRAAALWPNGVYLSERHILALIALSHRFLYVDRVLFHKMVHDTSAKERHGTNDILDQMLSRSGSTMLTVPSVALKLLRAEWLSPQAKAHIPALAFHHGRVLAIRLLEARMERLRPHLPLWVLSTLRVFRRLLRRLSIGFRV
jgi:glycosyltransferase involved in cell wall biosynthesis